MFYNLNYFVYFLAFYNMSVKCEWLVSLFHVTTTQKGNKTIIKCVAAGISWIYDAMNWIMYNLAEISTILRNVIPVVRVKLIYVESSQ